MERYRRPRSNARSDPQRPTERLDLLYDCTKENLLVVEVLRKGMVLIDRLGRRDLTDTLDY